MPESISQQGRFGYRSRFRADTRDCNRHSADLFRLGTARVCPNSVQCESAPARCSADLPRLRAVRICSVQCGLGLHTDLRWPDRVDPRRRGAARSVRAAQLRMPYATSIGRLSCGYRMRLRSGSPAADIVCDFDRAAQLLIPYATSIDRSERTLFIIKGS